MLASGCGETCAGGGGEGRGGLDVFSSVDRCTSDDSNPPETVDSGGSDDLWSEVGRVWALYWPGLPSVALLLVAGVTALAAILLELCSQLLSLLQGQPHPSLLSHLLVLLAFSITFSSLSIDASQLPAPLGPRMRALALPLLRGCPLLSLSFVRALLLMLALAMMSVEESQRKLSDHMAGFLSLLAVFPTVCVFFTSRRIPCVLFSVDVVASLEPLIDVEGEQGSESSLVQGAVSLSNLASVVPLVKTELAEALVTLDLDRNGCVSRDDLEAWVGRTLSV